jgi:hypothetical protein
MFAALFSVTLVRADPSFVETEKLRVVDYDAQPYLVRHATQSFLSGLEALEPIFSYVPDGKRRPEPRRSPR